MTALLRQLPAISLTGPRASGKTTTARRHAKTVVRLDRPAEAAAFHADADVALRDLEPPVLLDEWQAVPDLLGAVKRAVDDDPRPGRFILTGSARVDLEARTWPGTGRLVRLQMYGLSTREIEGRVSGRLFIDRLIDADTESMSGTADDDLASYIDRALLGGFPEAVLRLSGSARRYWLDGYVDQLITRDAPAVAGPRDPERLRRFLEALALNTSGVVQDRTLYEGVGIDRRTAVAYEQLLKNLFVVEALPAWWSNRLTRLVSTPKRFVVDSSLVGSALLLTRATVLGDGNLLGRMLETFVFSQIRPELEISENRARCYHLRDKGGRHEVDLVIEYAGGRIAAIEVKASSAPGQGDARHLNWLRDELGDRFVAGVVLHTGPKSYALSERVIAAPISTLWV